MSGGYSNNNNSRYGGGGGGYRGKRGRGGGYNNNYRNNQRSKNDSEMPFESALEEEQFRVTSLFFKLGDNKIINWDPIVADFSKEYALSSATFLKGLQLCLTQVAFKIPFYAVLTGLLNADNHDVGAAILETAAKALNEALEKSDFTAVKLLIRYFACCLNANVIMPDQLITLFDCFLNVIQEPSVAIERADAFVFTVMAALPWCSSTLHDRNLIELERIFNVLNEYMNLRGPMAINSDIPLAHKALSMYRDTTIDTPYIQKDYLELVWVQLQDLKQNGWNANILLNPYLSIAEKLSSQLGHEISAVSIPSSVTPVKFTYQPKFWIFNDSVNVVGQKSICHLPSTFSISRFILDDMITDTIRIFSLNHNECTTLLLNIERYISVEYVVKHKYQVYESVVESIFAEMFKLPKPTEKGVYYVTLIMDLCKESLDKIPSVLGRCIKLLFKRLDGSDLSSGMDPEGIKRFAEFFAIHLSNFGFSWKWADWSHVLKQETTSAQFVFVREVLEKCIRLAYFDRIKNCIPEGFEKHGSIFPSSAPSYVFRYEDASTTGDDALYELINGLKLKISSREDATAVQSQLELIKGYISQNASSLDNSMAMSDNDFQPAINIPQEALFQCVMFHGHKSFSHLLNVIELYLPLLQEWNQTDESRLLTTQIVFSFWSRNTQFLEIILGKLVNYRIIDSKSVITFLLSTQVLDNSFDRLFVWSILSSTLNKMVYKVKYISEKLEKMKADPEAASAMNDDTPDNVHGLEEHFQAAQKEKKDMFLLTFKSFVNVLAQKLNDDGAVFLSTPYWKWVSGQLRNVGREFQSEVDQSKYTIDALVFGAGTNEQIMEIWKGMQKVYQVQQ